MTTRDTITWDTAQSATCRSCGGSIRWVLTGKGRRMPVDPDPVDNGNVTLAVVAGVVHATVHGDATGITGVARYISHFATCPEAHKHRRRR
jgi:hypothetical protein